jgi:hypothetical protein
MATWNAVWILLIAMLACEAKLQSGTLTLGGDLDEFKWKYVSKFGYNIGSGTWAIRFKTVRPYVNREASITADVFLDLEWEKVENEPKVCDRHKHRRASGTVKLPPSGEWSEWINGTLSQSARAYVWYVSANDCKNTLGSPTRIKFEYVAKQENGDEFSVEMIGSYWISLLELLFFSVLSWKVYGDCKRYIRSTESLHPVMITVVSMVALHFASVFCQFLHFRSYSYDGQGLKALDVISEILNVLSQVVGTSLLILIALGYTLLHSKLGNLDVVIPVVFIIGVLHVLLVGFGKIKDDASYKFYENEGAVGWVLLILRALLLAWFVWAVKETRKESTGIKMVHFLHTFLIAGIIYFLSYPLVFVITSLFVPYMRYKVMHIGSFLMRFGSYIWMARLFLKKGEYYEVSTLKSSFLPGGVIPGLTKEE